jgi:hypothetical protein
MHYQILFFSMYQTKLLPKRGSNQDNLEMIMHAEYVRHMSSAFNVYKDYLELRLIANLAPQLPEAY